MGSDLLLKINNLVKSYAGNVVLNNIDFDIKAGEIHGLVGENGAGKSTLIKIITGFVQRNAGKIIYNNQEIGFDHSRKNSQRIGISAIYQELSLISTLTVAQNIFLGREPLNRISRLIDRKKIYDDAFNLIKKYNFDIDVYAKVEDLSIAKKQLVEILKALSLKSSLIIMDEPTASLNVNESATLFQIIKDLKKSGMSIIYISHRMEEIYSLADRVTILRDGKVVSVLDKENINPDEIIRLMIGRNIAESLSHSTLEDINSETVLTVKNLSSKDKFNNISLELKKGEILGISGLMGSGRTELIRAIFGADPYDSGEIIFNNQHVVPSIQGSINQGFGFVPEDRRLEGFIHDISIQRNIGVCNFEKTSKTSVMNYSREKQLAEKAIDIMNINPKNSDIKVGNLSGGNQQKVVLGKWFVRDLKILIIDEPTAGVDIAAKKEIYSIIQSIIDEGVSVLLVTSDLPELTLLSNRILVMRNGCIVREFHRGEINEEMVLKAASGIEV